MEVKNKSETMSKAILSVLCIVLFCICSFLGLKILSEQKQADTEIRTETALQSETYLMTTFTDTQVITYESTSNDETKSDFTEAFSVKTGNEYVYITQSGSKYHLESCKYLKSKIEITKTKAIEEGYTPCSHCKP